MTERHGHLDLDPAVRQRVLAVSAATIDRLLASLRSATPGRKKRRAKPSSREGIPVRTFADYGDALPGYLEPVKRRRSLVPAPRTDTRVTRRTDRSAQAREADESSGRQK